MQHHKQIIQLSDHVKNKIRSHQLTPFSGLSDELIISDEDTDNDSFNSSSPQKLYRRRSCTFTTYEIQQPIEPELAVTYKRINSTPKKNLNQQQLCQECIRRENLLKNEHQRLLHIYDENRKLTEKLHSTMLLNHQYEEENSKLIYHLKKLTTHLQDYQINFNLLKQKIKSEKTNNIKQNNEIDQIKRLRHELHVYNQVIAAKQEKEQEQIRYLSYQNWIQKK